MRGCHTVVALQLDICGFTLLSSALSPVELAETVSKLFSDFDEVVMGTNIFKIDTIGDAYIMVGWLHAEGPQLPTPARPQLPTPARPQLPTPASGQATAAGALEELDEEQRELEDAHGTDARVTASDNATKCADMLLVAEALLEIVHEHNLASSLPLDVRIGAPLLH
jgi:class 3 adenylate cyclase